MHVRPIRLISTLLLLIPASMMAQQTMNSNPFTGLMLRAKAHAEAHHGMVPVLSPVDASLLSTSPRVDVEALHAAGIRVIPWTTNDPAKMRALLSLGIDGLISDRPDLLQAALAESRKAGASIPKNFDVQGHRGGRGLRPENTLPAFEAGLDNLISTIETDTGVTSDHQSIIWHDQFLNPESCRRVDGKPYDFNSAFFHRDHTLRELQSSFICDKLHSARFPDQRNELALSPVAVAFAQEQHKPSPYSPTTVDELFRFTAFYAEYYRSGPGHAHPEAEARAENAKHVRFNLETKILPLPEGGAALPAANQEPTTNHTVDPQTFVATLCGAITQAHMQARADVQSFDFRTLQLVEAQFPKILTVYLTEAPEHLSTDFVPATLRQPR